VIAASEAAIAAYAHLEETVTRLLAHDLSLSDYEVEERREELEASKREVESLKQDREEWREELVRMWNEMADPLRGAIAALDNQKRRKK
jgi:FtsZ-binding cell division protein ZapB